LPSLVLFCSYRTEDNSLYVAEFLAQNKSNGLDCLRKSYDWIEEKGHEVENLFSANELMKIHPEVASK
tara:strand:- start:15891 stop:16094 length:204 start_codon:yes stop_codon:yes gene_type:complete